MSRIAPSLLSASLLAAVLTTPAQPTPAQPTLAQPTLAQPTQVQTPLEVLGRFRPAELDDIVGLGFDGLDDRVWLYGGFRDLLRSYRRDGAPEGGIARAGESANNIDIEFAPAALRLGSALLPAGTLLLLNGERGAAEIYAIDPDDGAVLAVLFTGFGASHVVGGAYHPARGSFFLLQDRLSGDGASNRVAEIDPSTGEVLADWPVTGPSGQEFTVSFGDLDIDASSGRLFIVSSAETSIAMVSPQGEPLALLALPDGVDSAGTLAVDDRRGELWLGGPAGVVWRLGYTPGGPRLFGDGFE